MTSVKCTFMGYSSESKDYILYDPITKKIIISRDVKSLENQSWDDSVVVSSSFPRKVLSVDEEEDDISDEPDDGATINIDNCRQKKKGKQHLACLVTSPSTSR